MYMHVEKCQDALLPPPTAQVQNPMLNAWSLVSTPISRQICIHDLFALQAVRTPNVVAVADATTSLTYGALDAQANQLAHVLQAYGDRKSVV